MSNPWERAYESAQRNGAVESRQGELQASLDQSGVMGAAGFMIAASVAPLAMRYGGQRAVKALGTMSRQNAQRAKSVVSSISSTAARRGAQARAAAVRQAGRRTSGVSLSEFAEGAGFRGAKNLKKRAGRWADFKKSDAARNKGLVGAVLSRDAGGQRRLMGDMLSHLSIEQAAALPATYAIDSYLGLTSPPGDRPAIYDVAGHASNFIDYLPTYATYELGAKLGGLALRGAGRAARAGAKRLGESPAVAKKVSQTYSALERAGRGAASMGSNIRTRYRQDVRTRSGMDQVKAAAKSARAFLSDQARAMRGRRGTDPTQLSATLRGADKVFTPGARASDFVRMAVGAKTDEAVGGLRRIRDTLFVEGDEQVRDPLARLFGGKAVTIKDLEDSDARLTKQAREQMSSLKKRVEAAKKRVGVERNNVQNPEAARLVQGMNPEQLRVSGYAKIGGKIMRMPTTGDLRAMGERAAQRATRFYLPGTRQGTSIANIFGVGDLGKPRPAIEPIEGSLSVENKSRANKLFYFGNPDDAPRNASTSGTVGFAVHQTPGSAKGSLIGLDRQGDAINESDLFLSPSTDSKLYRLRMRPHYNKSGTSEKELFDQAQKNPQGYVAKKFAQAKEALELGGEHEANGLYRRMRDFLGGRSPRRLFAKDSQLWNTSLAAARREEILPVADAMFYSREALIKGTDVYTRGEVFKEAAQNVLSKDQIRDLGGLDRILKDDETAFRAADMILDGGKLNKASRAPTTARAQKIINEARADTGSLYNPYGEPRGQQLRRFIFEQGALGRAQGANRFDAVESVIDNLARKGEIKSDLAVEAKTGLVSLRMQERMGGRVPNPYETLREADPAAYHQSDVFRGAVDTLSENRQTLEEFAASRPRIDMSYHRGAYDAEDYFGSGIGKEAGFYAVNASPLRVAGLALESGMETARQALSGVGLGWSPSHSLSTRSGLTDVAKLWGKRGAAVVAASAAYRVADYGTDAALPDALPGGEGITRAGADMLANARLSASYVYDTLGIDDAASYMEGLMPKSTSILPGAAAGYWAAGVPGAVAGAALNRATQPLFKDTPMEALSIAPPLAPFVSDLTESYETTKEKYSGERWVPVREGRFFLLSGSPYEGERIESYRPNWYTLERSEYEQSDALYGSAIEEMIHKDFPLVDISIGDVFDPQYLQKKHYSDRPYVSPDRIMSDVPLIGPYLGQTVGRLYNLAHPMASNRPMHMEKVVGSFAGEGVAAGGVGAGQAPNLLGGSYGAGAASASVGSTMQGFEAFGGGPVVRNRGGAAYQESRTLVGANDPSAVLDEQFYRLSEAMGFTGFAMQQAAGGEGIFRRPRFESASRIDSTGRAFHDLQMGDMLGIGEGVRRLYPFERGGETVGPRNTMPDWMPEDFKCITPETIVEVNGLECKPASDLKAGDLIRTHTGAIAPVTGIQRRSMEEGERLYSITIGNLGNFKMEVSQEHPLWTKNGWVEADNINKGEWVGYPVPELDSLFEEKTIIDLADYAPSGATVTDEWVYNWNGEDLYKLVEYIETEKNGNPYWEYGECVRICKELGIEYKTNIGARARSAYKSLINETSNGLNRFKRFINIDTPEFGTLAGYFVAEGSVTNNQTQMAITGWFGEEYADAVESVFGYRPKREQQKSESITRWKVNSTILSNFFAEYLGKDSFSKSLRLSKNNWKDFLRTLFNGDGSFFETSTGKFQCSLKQNHNPELLYQVWQVALSHRIVGAIGKEALLFRCDQAVEFARLIGLDKAESYGIFDEPKPHIVDISKYVGERFDVTNKWVYNRSSQLTRLVEYIETEKNGDPYWKKGEVQKACTNLGIEYDGKHMGPSARRSYRSLHSETNGLYRISRHINVNDCDWLTSNYYGRDVLEEVVQGLREDGLIPLKYDDGQRNRTCWHFDNGYWWTRLKSKEEIPQKELVSINVQGDHSFCLPGLATHNSGDPYCLHPSTVMEVDEKLVTAEEAYEIITGGPLRVDHQKGTWERPHSARTHEGRLRPFTGAARRKVDESIVHVDIEGLPWPLRVTKEHPLYVMGEEGPEWKLAGELTEDDVLLEPKGPTYDQIGWVYWFPGKGKPHQRYALDQSGVSLEAILSLFDVEPPPKDSNRYNTDGLDADQIYAIETAFDLPGCRYRMRKSTKMTRLRRYMNEYGLHPSIIGTDPGALSPIIDAWGERTKNEVIITITPERAGRTKRHWWRRHFTHDPEATDEELVERIAYTLNRMFSANDTPAEVEKDGDTCRVILTANSAVKYIATQAFRLKRSTGIKPFRRKSHVEMDGRHVKRPVKQITEEHYEGYVYAFEVEDDSSFVAAGVATHNSKVAMGEALLPGEGLARTGALDGGQRAIDASEIGQTVYETSLRMLGVAGDETDRQTSWAKERVKNRMMDMGAAIREEAVYVDERHRLTAVASAATRSNQPIHIEALSDSEFRRQVSPRSVDAERLNAMLGAAGRAKGMLAYVNADTGQVQTYVQNFDSGLYNKSVQKLQAARTLAKEYAAQGYGAEGAMYGPTDRMRALLNSGPFSDAWQVEMKKSKALYHSGSFTPEERRSFESIVQMHDKMGLPFEMYPRRFRTRDLMNPSEQYANLSYNENVQAAAEYSLPERLVGSVWETATHARSPLHSKFFGNYSPAEQYERRVLLEREFQSWGQPIDDFVMPYARGLVASDDPLQGAMSYGVGGAVFGGPAFGAIGAIAGTAYGTARGAYERLTGNEYVPEKIQDVRRVQQQFDRIRYYRAQRLYQATGAREYQDEMSRSALGWTQEGLEGDGWAKNRRRAYAPSERLESGIYNTDRGFSSPYQGNAQPTRFREAVRSHGETTLSIGEGSSYQTHVGRHPAPAPTRSASSGAAEAPPARINQGRSYAAPDPAAIDGMSEQGAAKANRQRNTEIRGNRGFASPWQGQDPLADAQWRGSDPTQSPLPPEVLTMYGAASPQDRDYVEAFLRTRNPDDQAALLKMVSPDMASMMEVGWNYLYERPMQDPQVDPMRALDMELSDHPVMGMGAYMDGYEIKTLEGNRLDARDGGLGWKSQRLRMEGAFVAPENVSGAMQMGGRGASDDPQKLRMVLSSALAQMGIQAEIDVAPTAGPSEIHVRQNL